MNHLEKKMRYSNAFSALNSLRNKIANVDYENLDLNSKEVILDAIEISTDRTEKGFEKALLYGFYNSGDTIKSSALELAKVISEGLQKKMIDEAELYLLRDVINQAQLATDSENLLPKIDCLMVLLNGLPIAFVTMTTTIIMLPRWHWCYSETYI